MELVFIFFFTNTKLGLERIWRYGLASQYKKNFLPFITSFNLHLEAILVGVQIAREVNLEQKGLGERGRCLDQKFSTMVSEVFSLPIAELSEVVKVMKELEAWGISPRCSCSSFLTIFPPIPGEFMPELATKYGKPGDFVQTPLTNVIGKV